MEEKYISWSAKAFPNLDPTKHVVFFEVLKKTHIFLMDMKQFDPYKAVVTVFHTLEGHVLGGIHAHDVFRLKGHIDLTLNLVNRGDYVPLFKEEDDQDNKPMEIDTDNDDWFWIPIVEWPRKGFVASMKEPTPLWDVAIQRVAWYLSNGKYYKPPKKRLPYPNDELGVFLLTGIIEAALSRVSNNPPTKGAKHQLAFKELRSRLERQRFKELYDMYVTSEDRIIELLIHNGLYDFLTSILTVEPTPLDMQYFYLRHPKGTRPPTIMFRALLEEAGPDAAAALPLYECGTVHLAYTDLFDWMWNCIEIQHFQMLSAGSTSFDPRILEEARRIHAHFTKYGLPPTLKEKGVSKTKTSRDALNISIESNEDLLALMPPCFNNLMTQHGFMKNNQRWPWLITLREAGVSKGAAVAWLEEMNTRYPHETHGYATLKARVDYDKLWEYRKGDECMCGNIVNNTVSKKPDAIYCPYAKGATADIEDIVTKSKGACMTVRKDFRNYRGPGDLIYRALKEQASKKDALVGDEDPFE